MLRESGRYSIHHHEGCGEGRFLSHDLVGNAFSIVRGLLKGGFPFEFGSSPQLLVKDADAIVEKVNPMLKPVAVVHGGRRCVRACVVDGKGAKSLSAVRKMVEVLGEASELMCVWYIKRYEAHRLMRCVGRMAKAALASCARRRAHKRAELCWRRVFFWACRWPSCRGVVTRPTVAWPAAGETVPPDLASISRMADRSHAWCNRSLCSGPGGAAGKIAAQYC
jgi:hypothetical protein